MAKYRFKTETEFIRDGEWETYGGIGRPSGWTSNGAMNKYLGLDVPDSLNFRCDDNDSFGLWGWSFSRTNYVLKASNPLPSSTGFDLIHVPEITI